MKIKTKFPVSLAAVLTAAVMFTACQDEVNTVSDEIVGTAYSSDNINGTVGDDDIDGTSGNDVIRAGKGNDKVDGKGGNDKVDGDSGNDKLNGGAGNDSYIGGKGADEFRFKSGELQAPDVDRIEDLNFADGDIIIFQNQSGIFGGVTGNGQVKTAADLKEIIDYLNNDGDPATEAYNADPNGTINHIADNQLRLLFNDGYELHIDDFGGLAQQDGVTFEFRNQENELKKFGKTDPHALTQSSEVNLALSMNGDTKGILIDDFDLAEGDVLKFKNARNVNGDGAVANVAELEALKPFFVGKVDADGDGTANDLYYSVDPDGYGISAEGYDFILRDIGGVEADDYNGADAD